MVKKLIAITASTILISIIIGMIFDERFKARWDLHFIKAADTLVMGTLNYDILLLGNSRINFGLNPYYFDSILDMKTYNFGLAGMDPQYFQTATSVYMSRRKAPQLVCVGLDEYAYMNISPGKTLYPYLLYANNKYINHYLQENGFPMQAIRFLPFLKYAYMDEYYKSSIFAKERPIPKFGHNIYNGFINLHPDEDMGGATYDIAEETAVVSYKSTAWIDQLLKTYSAKNVKVVFIYPPQVPEIAISYKKHLSILDAEIEKLQKKYEFNILNCKQVPSLTSNYFVDQVHLNEPGTQIFSKYVAQYIKTVLNEDEVQAH